MSATAVTTLFDPWIETIADAYDALPIDTPADHHYWHALSTDSVRRATAIKRHLDVFVTDDEESYATPEAMIRDIERGMFVVSRANSDHPVWTPEENVAFRTVHDVLGHYGASKNAFESIESWDIAGFDWRGENLACGAHFPLLAPDARVALFTECIAQTGFAIARGGFGEQKVGAIHPRILSGPAPDPGYALATRMHKIGCLA